MPWEIREDIMRLGPDGRLGGTIGPAPLSIDRLGKIWINFGTEVTYVTTDADEADAFAKALLRTAQRARDIGRGSWCCSQDQRVKWPRMARSERRSLQ